MEDMTPCSTESQEVFQRVWQRVMAGRDGAQCPIESIPANLQGDLSCECLEALLRQEEGVPPECERQEESLAPEQSAPEPPMEGLPAMEAPAEEQPVPETPVEEQPGMEMPAG